MQMATPIADELGRYLDLSSLELKLTAQNMANVDTPNYRTQGFDFASEMARSLACCPSAAISVSDCSKVSSRTASTEAANSRAWLIPQRCSR